MQFRRLKERIEKNKRDFLKGTLLIISIELVLVLLFFLPAHIKEQLVLHKGYTNFIDLLGNNYVHEDVFHLSYNMIGYLIVSTSFFMLVFLLGDMKIFYRMFLLNLVFVPLAVSIIWMPINENVWTITNRTLGFSAVNAGLMGSVIISYVFDYLRLDKFNRILLSVFLPISLLLLYAYIYLKNPVLIAFIIPLVAIYVFSAFGAIPDKSWLRGLKQIALSSLFYTAPFIFVILFSWSLFPANIVTESGIVGVYNHFSGFLVGLVVAYVLYDLSTRRMEQHPKEFGKTVGKRTVIEYVKLSVFKN